MFEFSVQWPVSRDFAWQFWTHVENWSVVDPSVEWAKLEGPFVAGTKGTTKPRGLDPIEWQLLDVYDGSRAVIEVCVFGGTVRFGWTFEDCLGGGTMITQRFAIPGEGSDEGIKSFVPELEAGIPLGMKKLGDEMVRAAGKQVH